MCFVLYLASDHPVPAIPWDEADRKLHTRELNEHDGRVVEHFKKAFVKYVGSDQGCGCGFRHVGPNTDEWGKWIPEGEEEPDEEQVNHRQLHSLLSGLLEKEAEIELFGCWNGDYAEPSSGSLAISPATILDEKFHFSERRCYLVTADP